jgi:hypothetical protein
VTPKLSNLDIPEIKAAAADWALASSQIEKISLHRFKPSKLQGREGPLYAFILWVSPGVDIHRAPWMVLSKRRVGKAILFREKVRKQYTGGDGEFDIEKAALNPLYGMWDLFWKLSAKESRERECFYSFYRDGFDRPDPRFDWLVMLLNVGNESLFNPGKIYDDLDNTDLGSILLFSRKSEAPQEDDATTRHPQGVESCAPEMINDRQNTVTLPSEPIKRIEAPQNIQGSPERAPAQNIAAGNTPRQGQYNKMLFDEQVWADALRLYKILLKTGFDGSDADKKLQRAAKGDLARNKKLYKFIKQKHLDKIALFALNPGQERRDFMGKLLQMITRGNRSKKPIGAQRLYDFGKKNYQNHH